MSISYAYIVDYFLLLITETRAQRDDCRLRGSVILHSNGAGRS